MLYQSTREGKATHSGAQAILAGLASDGGLFTPDSIPQLSLSQIDEMKSMTYQEKAFAILSLFLDDFPTEILLKCVNSAYNEQTFNHPDVAPLVKLTEQINILELYHGPTCAFKDIALQILPHLLMSSASLEKDDRTYVILVATSGDTGKAALSGFQDVDRTKIVVFYPKSGVSTIQKLQMVTQEGENLKVIAVKGNFDDTQTGVKKIFSDEKLRAQLEDKHYRFSSANSINWGRLAPQIVYYFSSYCDLLQRGEIKLGEEINFVVPTGNFGNILAGYIAKKMGLPIHRLVCAANKNNVLTDFINSGVYDRNRDFNKTVSPSMDILISSNLERLLYLICQDASEVRGYMQDLADKGSYQVSDSLKKSIQSLFWSDCSDDNETIARIRSTYEEHGYLMDTHTAVAMDIHYKYKRAVSDNRKTVIVSTASPFKFNSSVAKAILAPEVVAASDEVSLLTTLSEESGMIIPDGLSGLDKKDVLHKDVVEKSAMQQSVVGFLNL
jgi:threonine synthase